MSIQVLSLAAASLGDSIMMNDNHKLSSSTSSSPTLTSVGEARGRGSPMLSVLAARNARDIAQLRASLNSNNFAASGLWTSVGPESSNTTSPSHHRRTTSGIVSHLRASSTSHRDATVTSTATADTLVRAKAAAPMNDAGTLLALQRAYALGASNASNTLLGRSLSANNSNNMNPFSLHAAAGLLHHSPSLNSRLAMAAALIDHRFMSLQHAAGAAAAAAAAPSAGLSKNQDANSVTKPAASMSPSLAPINKNPPRRPKVLFMDCDEDSLSEYQCLIRQQMELFEATSEDANSSVQGRNKQIFPGQVGIRCRHCSAMKHNKGNMYFPTKLDRIYQAAQNLSAFHLCGPCPNVPAGVKKRIMVLRERKSPAGGGKRYWAEGVRCLGVVEVKEGGLKFA